MTNIEQKAIELVNDARRRNFLPVLSAETISGSVSFPALRYAIEDHERFRQEVSDALEKRGFYIDDRDLGRFIIDKPDPLVEVLADMGLKSKGGYDWASEFRNTLARRGLEIREKEA